MKNTQTHTHTHTHTHVYTHTHTSELISDVPADLPIPQKHKHARNINVLSLLLAPKYLPVLLQAKYLLPESRRCCLRSVGAGLPVNSRSQWRWWGGFTGGGVYWWGGLRCDLHHPALFSLIKTQDAEIFPDSTHSSLGLWASVCLQTSACVPCSAVGATHRNNNPLI